MTISHTLYLKLSYFLYASFPMGVLLIYYRKFTNNVKERLAIWNFFASFMVIPYFIFYGGKFFISTWNWNWVLIIILGIVFTVGPEFFLCFIFKNKIVANPFSLASVYSRFGMLKTVIYEELLFRNILVDVLETYNVSSIFILFYTSLCYSFGHYFLGRWSMLTKFLWGVVLGVIVLYTRDVIVAILIHFLNNMLIYLFFQYSHRKREVI